MSHTKVSYNNHLYSGHQVIYIEVNSEGQAKSHEQCPLEFKLHTVTRVRTQEVRLYSQDILNNSG